MIIVAFVSFSLFNFVGDPVNSMTGEDASDERRAEVREVLGLNDPVYVQFTRFCWKYSYKEILVYPIN